MKKLFLIVLLIGMGNIANVNALTCNDIKNMHSQAQIALGKETVALLLGLEGFQTLLMLSLEKEAYEDMVKGCSAEWKNPQGHQLTFPGKTQDEAKIIIMKRNISDFRNRGEKENFDMLNARRYMADKADKLIDELEESFKAEAEDNKESENQ